VPSAESRFWAKVIQAGDCWQWTGCVTNGYGNFRLIGWRNGETVLSHRLSYEWMVGEIPDGLHLDHLCRNRAKTCHRAAVYARRYRLRIRRSA
jgi:hypothetical protein